jgi:ferredoxin
MAADGELEIAVDREACMSSTACTSIASRTFAIDDEGISTVLEPPGDDVDTIVDAAESCPVRAIRVRRAGRDLV